MKAGEVMIEYHSFPFSMKWSDKATNECLYIAHFYHLGSPQSEV